ncbi:TPA: hypothetical protein ACU9OW_000033 [Legionella pneumophila]
MKALIGVNNKILDVKDSDFPVHSSLVWLDCPDECTPDWTFDGADFIAPVIREKSINDLLQEFNSAIQVYLDSIAKSRMYESSLHCASYANSTNPTWQQEAQTFVAWRDAVWLYAYSELALIQAGDKPIPTIEEFIQGLPELNW